MSLNHSIFPNCQNELLVLEQQQEDIPWFTEESVYEILLSAKKPRSSVSGDLPRKVLIEFLPELATPITHLWNKILVTCQYPDAWKQETTVVIPKTSPPSSKDDLSNIGLTPFLSKAFEKVLVKWLWDYVKSNWDSGQFGSRPGSSCTHYIIYLVDFVLKNWEKEKTSVLSLLLDWNKGFNRILHSRLITILSDLGVPPFLLRIIFLFLSNRKMIVRHNGVFSEEKDLNGGGPQGSLLIVILFCLYTNESGILRPSHNPSTLSNHEPLIGMAPMENGSTIRVKYVDDLSVGEAISMIQQVEQIPQKHSYCNTYRERTGHGPIKKDCP